MSSVFTCVGPVLRTKNSQIGIPCICEIDICGDQLYNLKKKNKKLEKNYYMFVKLTFDHVMYEYKSNANVMF